jgi:hypothetical protein
MSNQVTPLEAALARAEEAETNMKLAAQYGQELLEKMNKSEKMQVQLEQERHNLKLQLQSKESTEKAMQDEINRKKIINKFTLFKIRFLIFELIFLQIYQANQQNWKIQLKLLRSCRKQTNKNVPNLREKNKK